MQWKFSQRATTFDGQACVADLLVDRGRVIEQRVIRILASGELYNSPAPEPAFRVYKTKDGPSLQKPIVDSRAPRSEDPEVLLGLRDLSEAEKAILRQSSDQCRDRLSRGVE